MERFQNDPDCKLFLISLKAGGLGLNLTAAEYVFLLDPWWNPAVEGPGDRPHPPHRPDPPGVRLPADRPGHGRGEGAGAAADQERALADAIINADNSLIRDLGREDLELLLR